MVSALVLPAGSWWSWEILSSDGPRPRLAAGADLTYHHELELTFTDIAYLQLPAQFEHPVFREPTREEEQTVLRYVGERPGVVVAFDVEASHGGGVVPCVVAAEAYETSLGSFPRPSLHHPPEGEPAE